MKEDQQIHDALVRLDAEAAPHNLPTAAEAWSRLQFRLAYRARRDNSTSQPGTLLTALYVLAFLSWMTWSGWLSVDLLAIPAAVAVAAMFLFRYVSRSLEN